MVFMSDFYSCNIKVEKRINSSLHKEHLTMGELFMKLYRNEME
jgi:hypothetical protein